ncbi:MAG TPA: hypothetical protein VKC61_15305 [Pyrinomonadaceae bacterium]|nr:hypothetical protein [Pyrinomonadaceae bacterium]
MTRAELKHIQDVCHEWLRQPGVAQDSRRTISSSALSRPVELKITGLLTFDNVLITSVIDAETGICYTKLIASPGEAGEFFDTPFESIAPDTDAPDKEPAKVLTATRQRYQDAMARLHDSSRSDVTDANQIETDSWSWIIPQSERNDGDAGAKFLLYTNRKLLGYSLLERALSTHERRGRFHPSEDYFEYTELFAALPAAENEFMEANVQEAYGLKVDEALEARNRFNELLVQLEALKLYVENEDGQPIDVVDIKLEDLSRYYDDEAERWLYVTLNAER